MNKHIVYTKEKGKIETDNLGDVKYLIWHRLDGPAYQEFHDNGKLAVEVYYINDKQHRLGGPSFQSFSETGKLNYRVYYINGKHYTKTEYDAEIFKMKLALL